MSTLSHRPVWLDLASHSGRDIASFYSAVCGWEAAEGSEEFGGYFMVLANGEPVAGAMPVPADLSGGWTLYVQVSDVAATLGRVVDSGGIVIAEPIDIADMGQMAIFADPSGYAMGIWSPGTFHGFPRDGRVGAPAWFELYAKDYLGSQAFLSSVFGWTFDVMSDTPEFKYATVTVDGDQVLGIMDFSAEMHSSMPAYWNNYFKVADCDEAARRVIEQGGDVIMEPTDTPYGRMAAARDRNGAVFSLMHNPS